MARHDQDRYEPMPPLVQLPAWLWHKLGRRGKQLLGAIGLAAAIGAVFAIPAALDRADRIRAEEDRQAATAITERKRELRADQRPRRARMVRGVGPRVTLARAITRDVGARVRAGLIPGPAGSTECTAIGGLAHTETSRAYNCFTTSSRGSSTYVTQSGFRFQAKADLRTGTLLWCKTNPRPLHPDTETYVEVPLAPECEP